MRTKQLLACVLILVPLSPASAEPMAYQVGTGVPMMATGDPTACWSEPANLNGMIGSSEQILAFGLETELANDFSPSADTVTHATWWISLYNNYSCNDIVTSGFALRFYDDAGCTPGTLLLEAIPTVTSVFVNCQSNIYPVFQNDADVLFAAMAGGLYWFGAVQRDHTFPVQSGRVATAGVIGCDTVFKSAYFAFPDWTPAIDVFGVSFDASQEFKCAGSDGHSGQDSRFAWAPVDSASLQGSTRFWSLGSCPDGSDSGEVDYPPDPFPLTLDLHAENGSTHVALLSRIANDSITTNSNLTLDPACSMNGEARMTAVRHRSFRVTGGSGKAAIHIPIRISGNVASGYGVWHVEVGGVSFIGGSHGPGVVSEVSEWTGVISLEAKYDLMSSTYLSHDCYSCTSNSIYSLAIQRGAGIIIAPEPLISRINDVGNDQGRNVRIAWWKSSYDASGSSDPITGYAVYRREDGNRKAAPRLDSDTSGDLPHHRLDGWDFVVTVPARGDSLYQTVVPTLCDSTADGGICWSVFFVSAMTRDPLRFYDSVPDSGYSRDNLPPGVPQDLRWDGPTLIAWREAEEPDFRYFTVYGSNNPEFSHDAPFSTQTVDNSIDVAEHDYGFYFVATTDFAGNEGAAARLENTSGVKEDLPAVLALHPAQPNPVTDSVEIVFDLPSRTGVWLTIYDTSGREVRRLIESELEAGRHRATWDGIGPIGHPAPTGIYFARMVCGQRHLTMRFVLLR